MLAADIEESSVMKQRRFADMSLIVLNILHTLLLDTRSKLYKILLTRAEKVCRHELIALNC